MNCTFHNSHTDVDWIDDDITLSLCIDIVISMYNKRNKDKVRKRLREIFIYSRIIDYIMLKDALWISDNLRVPLFNTLGEHSEQYLDGHLIMHSYEYRKVFGYRTKNKEHHMNFQNFRLLFINSVLSTIHEFIIPNT